MALSPWVTTPLVWLLAPCTDQALSPELSHWCRACDLRLPILLRVAVVQWMISPLAVLMAPCADVPQQACCCLSQCADLQTAAWAALKALAVWVVSMKALLERALLEAAE
mmetsp:Transcript_78883/g.218228  ORF Transcript_78883/g.218228 Transcript_78883/m.218228 type:complete len:110 (+) Transcript_78883:634-963(+)